LTDADLRPPTEREFRLFQKLVYERAGIHLAPTKRALLNGRLARRVRELGLRTFAAYYDYVCQAGETETIELFDRITTNETAFFREPRHFRLLADVVFPALREGRSATHGVRLWSAGCSTGEEPYSLAMVAAEAFPAGWNIEIVASDLSSRVLRQAGSAVWPISRAEQVPKHLLKKYMLRGVGPNEGTIKAVPEIRSMIRFVRVNLHQPGGADISGQFDIIFCRNVLIYFDQQSKTRVVERLLEHLSPGGYLFVGHAESMAGVTDCLRNVEPTVYCKS
jgi:chemotaxis protein methyltransferase CheR